MVDVIINGKSGKLHAVYHKSDTPGAAVAVVLSGNPRQDSGICEEALHKRQY